MSLYFFFFQAEDGIRDVAVTGVQTCALPIYIGPDGAIVEGADRRAGAAARDVQDRVEVVLLPTPLHDPADHLVDPAGRLAAGRTLPAALVGVEPRDDHQRLGDRHRLVHHDHARPAG